MQIWTIPPRMMTTPMTAYLRNTRMDFKLVATPTPASVCSRNHHIFRRGQHGRLIASMICGVRLLRGSRARQARTTAVMMRVFSTTTMMRRATKRSGVVT